MKKGNFWKLFVLSSAAAVFMMTGCTDSKSDKGAMITGTVLNSSNQAVAGVTADLVSTTIVQTSTTNASGVYSFEDVDVGSYQIVLTKTGFVNDTIPVIIADGTDPQPLATIITGTNEQVGSISGTITGGGSNLNGVTVTLVEAGRVTSTNASGAYTFNNVLIGNYTVVANVSGYVADSVSVAVTANATITQNFTLTQSVILSGTLTTALTLDPNKVYTLSGVYQIAPGGILTVPAGTRIEAEEGTQAVIITVRASRVNGGGTDGNILKPNGKIYCMGTANAPVVFTTKRAAGTRVRGLWGGIVMNGIAAVNWNGGVGVGEGNTGVYGGGDFNTTVKTTMADTMSSGELHYTRVEFGGIKVTPDNEINGFTFNGVGSNTIVDHCQAHFVADDGFEFFGGKVNARYLVSSGNDDDNIDTDNGYSGYLQFILAIQDKTLGNRGSEADNDASGSSNTPLSNPHLWNFTYIGGNDVDDKNNDDNNEGMYLRRNTSYDANNGIVSFFNRYGLVFDGSADSLQAVNGTCTVKNSIFFNNKVNSKGEVAFKSTNYDTVGVGAVIANWNLKFQNPNFTAVNTASNGNPLNGTIPDPRPTSTVTGGTPTGSSFLDNSATYMGAFNTTTNWLTGWTIWSLN